jgi:hypothetical protein
MSLLRLQIGQFLMVGDYSTLVISVPSDPVLEFGKPVFTGHPMPWAITTIDATFIDGATSLTYDYPNATMWCAASAAAGARAISPPPPPPPRRDRAVQSLRVAVSEWLASERPQHLAGGQVSLPGLRPRARTRWIHGGCLRC